MKDEPDKEDDQDTEKRSKVAAMAFKRLFPSLPDSVQQEWQNMQMTASRTAITQWLMSRMCKMNNKWQFVLNNQGGTVQRGRVRDLLEESGARYKSMPRFRAVMKAGGEIAFKQALQTGEIKEKKSTTTGQTMFYWEEEHCSKVRRCVPDREYRPTKM